MLELKKASGLLGNLLPTCLEPAWHIWSTSLRSEMIIVSCLCCLSDLGTYLLIENSLDPTYSDKNWWECIQLMSAQQGHVNMPMPKLLIIHGLFSNFTCHQNWSKWGGIWMDLGHRIHLMTVTRILFTASPIVPIASKSPLPSLPGLRLDRFFWCH